MYQPPPHGVSFTATAGYFYLVNGLGLVGWDDSVALSTTQIEAAGRRFCDKPWREVKSSFAHNWCFSSAYAPALLDAYDLSLIHI